MTMCLAKIDQQVHSEVKGGVDSSSNSTTTSTQQHHSFEDGGGVVAFDVFSAAQVKWIRSSLRAQFGGETMRTCKSSLTSACTSITTSYSIATKNNTRTLNNNSSEVQHKIGSKRSRSSTRGSSSSVLVDHFNFSATFPSKLLRNCPHIQHPTVLDVRVVAGCHSHDADSNHPVKCSEGGRRSGSFVLVVVAANLSKDRWPTRIELIAPVNMQSTPSLLLSGVGHHQRQHALKSYSCPCTKRVGMEPTNGANVEYVVDHVVPGDSADIPPNLQADDVTHSEECGSAPPPLLAPSPHSHQVTPIPLEEATTTKPPCRHALMLALWYISQSVGW